MSTTAKLALAVLLFIGGVFTAAFGWQALYGGPQTCLIGYSLPAK